MTRPNVTRPNVGGAPSRGQLQDFIQMPAGQRPSNRLPSTGRPSQLPGTDRSKIKQAIGQTPGQRPSMPYWFKPGAETRPAPRPGVDRPGANRPGVDRPRPENPIANRPNRPNRPVLPPGYRPPGYRPPGGGAWRPYHPWYPGHPGYGRYGSGYWWRAATVVGLTGWVLNPWGTPTYTSYGDGGSVYYENNTVYVDGEQYATSEEYYDQASTIASSAPEPEGEAATDEEWMPLGVFALTSEGVNASSMYLQLAISKQAVIAGTFYNETTGATHPIEGMVDQETQRAAWRTADGTNEDVVMETGVFNLTEESTDVLVHFGPDTTQVWKMVRLDESEMPEAPAQD